MNKFLKNFYNLYSEDNQVCYKAILEKKDWLFQTLYIPIHFKETIEDGKSLYLELYGLLDSSFEFSKLEYSKDIFGSLDLEKVLKITSNFNEKFRFLKLINKIPSSFEEDTFYVEVNMPKMEDKVYKELVANFYPCLSKEELELTFNENDDLELLKLAMIGDINEWVLILSVDALINNRYYLPLCEMIHYNKKLTKEQKESIFEISEKIEVGVEEYE